MNIYMRLGATILVASSLSACATITRGTKTNYAITSEPSGADVALTTGQTCVTPCKLKLKRKFDFTAKISKPGYEVHETQVQSKISGGGGVAAAGNIIAGGIIGGIVDGTNGSLNNLYPGAIDAKLVPAGSVAAAPVEATAMEGAPAQQMPAAADMPPAEAAPADAPAELSPSVEGDDQLL